MFVGLGFKVAAAPFHVWTPDVYEGAPAPVVGFMSTAPKAAAFAVLLRVMFEANAPGRVWLIWVAAALSMTLGNVGALVQQNVKRLLAYSSIAHAGYLLVAFAALPNNGIPAAMFYTASYAAMNVGAFAVVSHFAGAGERYVTLDDYAGLGRRSPLLAATLTIFLLSLIGIPMTGGFFAKFYVFSAALQANLVGLTIIGVLNSAVGAYYYLRIIVVMYMREAREEVAGDSGFGRARRGAGHQRGRNTLSGTSSRTSSGIRFALGGGTSALSPRALNFPALLCSYTAQSGDRLPDSSRYLCMARQSALSLSCNLQNCHNDDQHQECRGLTIPDYALIMISSSRGFGVGGCYERVYSADLV